MRFKTQPLAFAYQLANKPQTGFSQINSHTLHLLAAFYPAAFYPWQVLAAMGRTSVSATSCHILLNTPKCQDLVHDLLLTQQDSQPGCSLCIFKGVAAFLLLFVGVYPGLHFLGSPWVSCASWQGDGNVL